MTGGDGLRARMERACARLEERIEDAATRSTERVRLEGKLEGVKLAMSYLGDEERLPEEPAPAPDLDKVIEPVLGMFRAQMRHDVWHVVWLEAAKASRRAVNAQNTAGSPAQLAGWEREAEVLDRVAELAARRKKAGLEAAERMRAIAGLPKKDGGPAG